MTFEKIVTLKDGRNCLLRNGVTSDGKAVLDVFNRTHEETDYLLTYLDENCFTASQEADFLQRKTDSANNVEIIAVPSSRVRTMLTTPGLSSCCIIR